LEETALAYRETWVNVLGQEQFAPEFIKLNPNSKLPVIVDDDGPGGQPLTLSESGAILVYLADKTEQLIPKDKAAYFKTLQWVFHQHGGLGPMGGQLAHFVRFAPPEAGAYPEQRYRTENNRLYDLYDSELARRPYIAGEAFTIADIAVWPWVCYAEIHGLDLDRRPHFKDWFWRIAERPAVKRIVDRFGWPQKTARIDQVSQDNRDRFFGWGKYARR